MSSRRLLTALLALLVLASVAVAGCSSSSAGQVVTILHSGDLTATAVPVTAGAASPGDVRVFSVATTDEKGAPLGHLRGTLTTTAVDATTGDEIRMAELVASFARPEDQIVIGGESAYPKDQSTIPAGTAIIRPIIGGSGIYAGARGYTETFHNADGTWRHVFHLLP